MAMFPVRAGDTKKPGSVGVAISVCTASTSVVGQAVMVPVAGEAADPLIV